MGRCKQRSFYCSGLKIRTGDARTLVDGRWVRVVTHTAGQGEINVQELPGGAALRMDDGLVLQLRSDALFGRAGRNHDAVAEMDHMAPRYKTRFARRLAAQPCDEARLAAVVNWCNSDWHMERAARNSSAAAVNAVLRKALGTGGAGPVVGVDGIIALALIPCVTDTQLLHEAFLNGFGSVADRSMVRLKQLFGENEMQQWMLARAREVAPDTTGLPSVPADDAWKQRGAVASRMLIARLLSNMAHHDAVTVTTELIRESNRRAARNDRSLQLSLTDLLRNTDILGSDHPGGVGAHMAVLAEVLAGLTIGELDDEAWNMHMYTGDPHADAVRAQAERLGLNLYESKRWVKPTYDEADGPIAQEWQEMGARCEWHPPHCGSLAHPGPRSRMLLEAKGVTEEFLADVALHDASWRVKRAALMRLADPVRWMDAVLSAGEKQQYLAEKAPVEVLREIAARTKANGLGEGLVWEMYQRGAIDAAVAMDSGHWSVRQAVLSTTRDEAVFASALEKGARSEIGIVAKRTLNPEMLQAAEMWTKEPMYDIGETSRSMELAMSAKAKQLAADGDIATARGLIKSLYEADVLWELAAVPELALWATARLQELR